VGEFHADDLRLRCIVTRVFAQARRGFLCLQGSTPPAGVILANYGLDPSAGCCHRAYPRARIIRVSDQQGRICFSGSLVLRPRPFLVINCSIALYTHSQHAQGREAFRRRSRTGEYSSRKAISQPTCLVGMVARLPQSVADLLPRVTSTALSR
jgi:hypothetical protein